MKQAKGIIFVLLSAICFASGGLFIKLNTWNSVSINGARSLLAFFVMLVYMLAVHHKFKMNWIVLGGAIANAGMSLTFTIANKLTTAANAIVLQFMMPVFIILLLWIIWKQKPDALSLGTVAAAFVGMICFFIQSLSAGNLIGDLIAVFSGFLYAIVFLIKKVPGADFESSVLLSHAISFVISIPFLAGETEWTSMNLISIVVLGIFQLGLAFVFLNVGLNHVQPIAAALISMIEPILNPILVAIFYGESIGGLSIVGAIIVLGAATTYNVLNVCKLHKK